MVSARALTGFLLLAATAFSQDHSAEFFEKRVRPLLTSKCYSCHTDSKLGGLRLDSRAAILTGGKSGPAIVAGKPVESLVIRAVTNPDSAMRMPKGGAK